jgi:hypothetical protein
MPIYLQVLFSIASVLVSAGAVVVSRAQWKLTSQKVRFDMFDRRLQAKEALLGLPDALIGKGKITSEAFENFRVHAYLCRFLFPGDGAEYIGKIYQIALRAVMLEGLIKHEMQVSQDSGKIKSLCDEKASLCRQIQETYKDADLRLDAYLKIA